MGARIGNEPFNCGLPAGKVFRFAIIPFPKSVEEPLEFRAYWGNQAVKMRSDSSLLIREPCHIRSLS
jgi:hypothetical protein